MSDDPPFRFGPAAVLSAAFAIAALAMYMFYSEPSASSGPIAVAIGPLVR